MKISEQRLRKIIRESIRNLMEDDPTEEKTEYDKYNDIYESMLSLGGNFEDYLDGNVNLEILNEDNVEKIFDQLRYIERKVFPGNKQANDFIGAVKEQILNVINSKTFKYNSICSFS